MCGALVFPLAIPTTTRFVYRQPVTDDVVGSPPPSSSPSSGWYDSSLETGATALRDDTLAESYAAYAAAALLSPQQQLMAEATRGLLAAAQQMAVARGPDRDRQRVAAARRGGAPVPPPLPPAIEMRFVPNTMMMPRPAAADVVDNGSSAPSTPSHCSSSFETTPSPRGPLPPPLPDSAAAACASRRPLTPGAAWRLATKPPMAPSTAAPFASEQPLTPSAAWGLATKPPPMPFPTAPATAAPRVEVRQVWAHNFDEEAKLIESLLPKFRYVAVDTVFPGTVYRPAGPAYTLKPDERYKLLRCTVDALDPIQLGLTLFDAGCRLPSVGDGATATATRYVWEFNFREFDDCHAPESRGVDLDRTRRDGVDASTAFGPRLRKWVRARAGLGRAGVVTSSGGYDLAYLVKMMLGPGFRMPTSAAEFEVVAKALLRRRKVFDVREMARLCPSDVDLGRGLDSVAAKLNLARRAAGEAHQAAGYGSLGTCYTFVKLREICFDDDGKLTSVDGILAEITAF